MKKPQKKTKKKPAPKCKKKRSGKIPNQLFGAMPKEQQADLAGRLMFITAANMLWSAVSGKGKTPPKIVFVFEQSEEELAAEKKE